MKGITKKFNNVTEISRSIEAFKTLFERAPIVTARGVFTNKDGEIAFCQYSDNEITEFILPNYIVIRVDNVWGDYTWDEQTTFTFK